MESKTLSKTAAKRAGFVRITRTYNLEQEGMLLRRVIDDMERGGIPWCLVECRVDQKKQKFDGVTLWRKWS
tara:strand:+ start:37 stop:249 length:213 start_codon:yes stop_codon:yes gene_type:complete